jgi:hypothetical protein
VIILRDLVQVLEVLLDDGLGLGPRGVRAGSRSQHQRLGTEQVDGRPTVVLEGGVELLPPEQLGSS